MNDDNNAEQVKQTFEVLFEACSQSGFTISGDLRVSEADASRLIGLAPATLKNLRQMDMGPTCFHRGVGGSRISYRLYDLARWIEAGREEHN